MIPALSLVALALAGGAVVACGGGGVAPSGTPADAAPEALPRPTAELLARLRGLSPAEPPGAPPDVSNALADDPRAAAFGQRLFFDASFSGRLLDGDNDGGAASLGRKGETGRVSCAGCHQPAAGFSDARSVRKQISLGAGWGRRRAPSLLDVSAGRLLLWDGRRDALHNQVFGPFESEVEMNSSRLFVAERTFEAHRAEYEALFGPLPPLGDPRRFPRLTAAETGCARLDAANRCAGPRRGTPGDGAEFDSLAPEDQFAVTRVVVNLGKALGAYERRLACGASAFDRYVQGEPAALSPAAARGAELFVGKAGCVACHSGPFLSDEAFHNVGLKPAAVATVFLDAGDRGAAEGLAAALADPLNVRGAHSDGDDGRLDGLHPEALEGAFRTPRLRCVSSRPSFMHTGQLLTLEEVVAFFDRGGDRFGYPGTSELRPLGLDAAERADLVEFLRSLEGEGASPALGGPP